MPVLSNPKHEAVAQAYLSDPEKVGWRAYRAGYPNTKQRAAESAWSRLLQNVEFAGRIAEMQGEAAQGAVATQRQVLEEITKIALSTAEKTVDKLRALETLAQYHGLLRPERDLQDTFRLQSDAQIFSDLAKQAAELGIDIDVTFNGAGE